MRTVLGALFSQVTLKCVCIAVFVNVAWWALWAAVELGNLGLWPLSWMIVSSPIIFLVTVLLVKSSKEERDYEPRKTAFEATIEANM